MNLMVKKEKILVVDDTPENLDVVKGILEKDYTLFMAVNGNLAIKIAKAQKPDLILLDIMMPEIDGYEVLRRLKQDEETNNIPVIFLTAKTEIEDEQKGLELGAVDYIVKPISPPILLARIRTQLRLKQVNQALINEIDERVRIQEMLQKELNDAAEYVKSLLPDPIQEEKMTIDWRFKPCSSLGGDAFGYHWLDHDHIAIYLIDVSGHGIRPALLSVSVINALRSQSLPNTDFNSPEIVLQALNKAFPSEKNNAMFFTIWYGIYNQSTRELCFASGGHPPALLQNSSDTQIDEFHQLRTPNIVIGALGDATFVKETIQVRKNAKLYIYSDGVYEIKKPDGSIWKLEEFVGYMSTFNLASPGTLDQLIEHTQTIGGSDEFSDDFTVMEITFG